MFANRLLLEAICISSTGLGHKHPPVRGTEGFLVVQRLLQMANLRHCSGCERKLRPSMG